MNSGTFPSFDQFRAEALSQGFDEVLERRCYGADGAAYWVARRNAG